MFHVKPRLAVGLGIIIAARLAAFWFFPLMSEDAAITFHAARDAAWHAATTSPLWAIMVMPDPEVFARFWTLLGDCGAVYAAWRILPRWGFWAFLAFWVSIFFTGSSVSGLETHLAACLILVGRVNPAGYFLAAALRPDMAVLALCSSGRRWVWALAGALVMLCVNAGFAGHMLPQTITSKALSYGVHPGAWGWLAPRGFGWETIALALALGYAAASSLREGRARLIHTQLSRPLWLHVGAAVAFLLTHVALGTTGGWWYAVPPLAMLGLAACEQIRRPWHLAVAISVMLAFAGTQATDLLDRMIQERNLWITGQQLAKLKPSGTILLEPAGMIPYQNRQLRVIDDVGLVDPWMAWRREEPGWRTAAIERYKPDWIVVRLREYMDPKGWTVGSTPPYNNVTESRLQGYRIAIVPGMSKVDSTGHFTASIEASSLIVFRRR